MNTSEVTTTVLAAAQTAAPAAGMTTSGWFLLLASWAAIVGVCVFCFWRIFSRRGEEHLVAPLEIETEPPPDAPRDADAPRL